MNSTLVGRIVSIGLIAGIGAVAACGGSSDDSSGTATPGAAGSTSGGSAGSSGSTSAGKSGSGGSTTAGSGGSTTAGSGGSTTAGSGGSTTAGSGGSTTAGSGGSTTAGAAGTAGTSAGGTAGAAGTGTGGAAGTGTGGCASPSVDVIYDLTGTTFEITDTPLGAGNQVNTVATPYTDPKNIGPGTMKIRFNAPAGQPDAGRIDVIAFDLVLEFTVNAGGSKVVTDLVVDVTPTSCSGAKGTFAGGTGTFMDPGFDPYHTKGTVTCTGATCTLGGLPNGMAVPRDTTEKLKLNPFAFTNGASDFTMPKVQVSGDSKSKTWLALKGKESSRSASCGCP